MLMPTLSVTAIAIVVALVAGAGHGRLLTTVLFSAAGAWAGFLIGALVGGTIDVVARAGVGVPIVGHLAAATGSLLAVRRHHEKSPLRPRS